MIQRVWTVTAIPKMRPSYGLCTPLFSRRGWADVVYAHVPLYQHP